MNVACVVEGLSEYDTVPSLLGRLGHTIVGRLEMGGGNGDQVDWESLIRARVVPRVFGMAQKDPDKLLVLLDREGRDACCPELALNATAIIEAALIERNIQCEFVVIVCDRRFEEFILTDYVLLDRLTILARPVSGDLPPTTDGINIVSIIKRNLRPGAKCDKRELCAAFVARMELCSPIVVARSRPFRKFLKEFPDVTNPEAWL